MENEIERLRNCVTRFWLAIENDNEMTREQKAIATAAVRTILLMFDNEELWEE